MDFIFINFKGVIINKFTYSVDIGVDNLPHKLIILSTTGRLSL